MTAADRSDVFRAVGHRWRRVILERLAERPHAVTELLEQMPLSMPALSSHLRILRDTGAVKTRRRGAAIIYQIDLRRLAKLQRWFDRVQAASQRKRQA